MVSLPSVLLLSLSLLLLLDHPSPSSAACNLDDQKVLLSIKQFWGNPPSLASWNGNTTCCAWDGVFCVGTASRVSALFLATDTSLRGTIPSAIANLPFLSTLQLESFPNLVGTIPDLTRLTRLTELFLVDDGLSGPIPAFLTTMTALEHVELSGNRFSGSIPPQFSSLPKLTRLDLSNNRLAGSIPNSFGGFKPETILKLARNRLTGPVPRSLGGVDFDTLDLSGNMLSGDASYLFRPTSTSFNRRIDISNNKFSFDLTSVLFPLKLVYLDISNNKIYGSIPTQISKLQLSFLNVRYNKLCGKIPPGAYNKDAFYFEHNLCLCGTPLPPCK